MTKHVWPWSWKDAIHVDQSAKSPWGWTLSTCFNRFNWWSWKNSKLQRNTLVCVTLGGCGGPEMTKHVWPWSWKDAIHVDQSAKSPWGWTLSTCFNRFNWWSWKNSKLQRNTLVCVAITFGGCGGPERTKYLWLGERPFSGGCLQLSRAVQNWYLLDHHEAHKTEKALFLTGQVRTNANICWSSTLFWSRSTLFWSSAFGPGWSSTPRIVRLTKNDNHHGPSACVKRAKSGQAHLKPDTQSALFFIGIWSSAHEWKWSRSAYLWSSVYLFAWFRSSAELFGPEFGQARISLDWIRSRSEFSWLNPVKCVFYYQCTSLT